MAGERLTAAERKEVEDALSAGGPLPSGVVLDWGADPPYRKATTDERRDASAAKAPATEPTEPT